MTNYSFVSNVVLTVGFLRHFSIACLCSRTNFPNKKIMADQNIEPVSNDVESNYSTPANDPKNMQEVTQYVQSLLQNMQDKFQSMSDQIINRIDEMGTRVDELEKNITDLMTQAGVEGEK